MIQGKHVHLSTKKIFEEETNIYEVVVALFPFLKLYQNIYITLFALLISCKGAEETDPLYAVQDQEVIMFANFVQDVFSCHTCLI